MSSGFIPIRRSLFKHFLFNEHRVFSRFEAWLDLIQLASFMDGQTDLIKGKAITRNRGEVVASIRWMADRWNWSLHKTVGFVELLRSQGMVVVGIENGITRLTLVNFNKHNPAAAEGNTLGNSKIRTGIDFEENQGTVKGTAEKTGRNSKRNAKGNSETSHGKGIHENQGTPGGTQKGTVGEQSGNSEGTNINNGKETKEQKEDREGASAPAPPRDVGRLEEKQQAMLARQKAFYKELALYLKTYDKKMIRAFYEYWSETNKSKTKMKFEMEDTWELSRRLSTWEQRDAKWNKTPAAGAGGSVAAKDLDYLYGRFLEGAQLNTLLQEKHCDYLVDAGVIEVGPEHIETAILYRIKNLTGTNNAGELRAIQAYQAGTWESDTDCAADAAHRYRIAKKLAAIELFNRCKTANLKTLEDAKEKLSLHNRD